MNNTKSNNYLDEYKVVGQRDSDNVSFKKLTLFTLQGVTVMVASGLILHAIKKKLNW